MRAALVAMLLMLMGPALAQAPAPLVRTTLTPAQGAVVGQPIRINVVVLFPEEMPHPPLVSVPAAAGGQILRFQSQATTIRDHVDGQDYVGQNFEFVLFPRRGGEIAIPAPKVTLLDRGGEPVGVTSGQPRTLIVSVPPGIDPSSPVLAADRVSATQTWTPDPVGLRLDPGGAIVRTITRRADGVPALGMVDFAFVAPEGVRVYVDAPVIDDRVDRGNVDGRRTDKVTYVFERGGTYELPPLTQPWWSLADKQARAETLPGTSVSVAIAAPPKAGPRRPMTGWLAIGLLAVAVLVAVALSFVRLWRPWRERYRASAAFSRTLFLKVAMTGDAPATYRALRQWRDRLSRDDAASLTSDPGFAREYQRLLAAIFADTASWDRRSGRALSKAAASWRPPPNPDGLTDPLPPLNPAERGTADTGIPAPRKPTNKEDVRS